MKTANNRYCCSSIATDGSRKAYTPTRRNFSRYLELSSSKNAPSTADACVSASQSEPQLRCVLCRQRLLYTHQLGCFCCVEITRITMRSYANYTTAHINGFHLSYLMFHDSMLLVHVLSFDYVIRLHLFDVLHTSISLVRRTRTNFIVLFGVFSHYFIRAKQICSRNKTILKSFTTIRLWLVAQQFSCPSMPFLNSILLTQIQMVLGASRALQSSSLRDDFSASLNRAYTTYVVVSEVTVAIY